MSRWSELLSTALVGTDRRPVPDLPPGWPLDWPLGTSAPAEPSEVPIGPDRVLQAAAAVTVTRRAGMLPERGVTPPTVAGAETTVPVPPAAAVRLRMLLDANRGHGVPSIEHSNAETRLTLMTEWLTLAAACGRHVPPAMLPQLLDEARTRTGLRPLVAAAGGQRARWLAGFRDEWAWCAGPPGGIEPAGIEPAGTEPVGTDQTDDETAWHEGTVAERLAYLARLRHTSPDRARELLDEAWQDEPPANRAALLSTLETSLGAGDEQLCERALDDKRKEVRAAAVALLGRLPGSAYQRRMTERALGCVQASRSGKLAVTPPVECDKAMLRDGIVVKPPQGTGERAWWLQQIAAATPLPAWSALDADPSALLARPVAEGWAATLLAGWTQATITQHDSRWAAALVRRGLTAPAKGRRRRSSADIVALRPLYGRLAAPDAIRVATTLLADDDSEAEYVVPHCPKPWPVALAEAALARLGRYTGAPHHGLDQLAAASAAGLDPANAPLARRLAETYRSQHPDHRQGDVLDRMAAMLTFRYQMHRELA